MAYIIQIGDGYWRSNWPTWPITDNKERAKHYSTIRGAKSALTKFKKNGCYQEAAIVPVEEPNND